MASILSRVKKGLEAPEEAQSIYDEYKKKYLKSESTPGDNILSALDKLGDYLKKTGIHPGKKYSKEQKVKMRKTVKFIADVLPHKPEEGLLFLPGATLARQAVKQTVQGVHASLIRQRASASIGGDIVSGRGVIKTTKGKLRDFLHWDDHDAYQYSSGLINKVRKVRKEFDKMSPENINILKLKLFKTHLSPGGATEKGFAKKYKTAPFKEEIDQQITFTKNFEGASKGKLDFQMSLTVQQENSIAVTMNRINKDGIKEGAFLYYELTLPKGSKNYILSHVNMAADEGVKTWRSAGLGTKAQAHRLGMQVLDQLPINTIIREKSLTFDSLFWMLSNALRAPKGKQIISKVMDKKILEEMYSHGRLLSGPSRLSKATKLSDQGDFVGLVDLVTKTEANLIKRGKMKGKIDKKGRILESELNIEVGHHPGGGLFLKYDYFEIKHLKSIIATIAGYQTWNAFRRAVDRQDKIDQKAL